jgi:hypothetical protein
LMSQKVSGIQLWVLMVMVSGINYAWISLTTTDLQTSGPKSAKTQSQETEPHSLDEDMPGRRAFKFFMNLQLALIMFLVLCWLYDHV